MRKSKTRKTEKKLKAKNSTKVQKEIKAKKRDSKIKYQEWLDLPQDQWTDARKAKNNMQPSGVENG